VPKPKRSLVRRLLFAVIPLILLLAVATIVLSALEEKKIIDTERIDDRVAYPPSNWLHKEKTPEGERWRIENEVMVKSSFAMPKPENTLRIVVAGGSFAMGTPYIHQNSDHPGYIGYGDISNWIQAELEMRYPSRTIEVINAAAGAQNSRRVYHTVKELIHAQPDAILVATGNNEGFIPASEINEQLHRWIVYRALKRTLRPGAELAKRSYFMPQHPESKAVEQHFKNNIRAMIKLAQETDAPLLLATLPINLKYEGDSPGVDHIPFPADDEFLQNGLLLQQQGKHEEAIEQFQQSNHHAHSAQLIAQSLEQLGRYRQAKEFYKLSVELNPKNRMRPSFNLFLRQICDEYDVMMADFERIAVKNSPHGLPGDELFADYCHMRWRGYYLCAREAVRQMINHDLIDGRFGEPKSRPAAEEIIKKKVWVRLR